MADEHDDAPLEEDLERFGDESGYCPHCGGDVWDQADFCPNCGEYMHRGPVAKPIQERRKRNILLTAIVIVALVSFVLVYVIAL